MSMTTAFNVVGMTCEHCVRSVKDEAAKIDGVRSVGVDLDSGLVTVESDTDLAADRVAAAVDEAGYEIAR